MLAELALKRFVFGDLNLHQLGPVCAGLARELFNEWRIQPPSTRHQGLVNRAILSLRRRCERSLGGELGDISEDRPILKHHADVGLLVDQILQGWIGRLANRALVVCEKDHGDRCGTPRRPNRWRARVAQNRFDDRGQGQLSARTRTASKPSGNRKATSGDSGEGRELPAAQGISLGQNVSPLLCTGWRLLHSTRQERK